MSYFERGNGLVPACMENHLIKVKLTMKQYYEKYFHPFAHMPQHTYENQILCNWK